MTNKIIILLFAGFFYYLGAYVSYVLGGKGMLDGPGIIGGFIGAMIGIWLGSIVLKRWG